MKWKPIPGFEGLYEISDEGHVVRISTHGRNPKSIRRPVRPHKKPEGYLAIDIQRDQIRLRSYVHRVVWEAFRGPIPSGLEINHRDGNRLNNRLDNLELVTRSANMLHSFQQLSPSLNRVRGTAHHKAKLTPADVENILSLNRTGTSQREIARLYGVSKTAIGFILKGRNWKHVTGIGSD